MTSILTNIAAMSALQTLRTINSSMEETQGRVSSGLRVGEAADNAAYWSIATTMRSDNAALGAVSDALGLGAAKVDTAYAGMEASIEVVKEIKTKLVAAREAGVDRTKIQEEIDQLQDQLKSIADSASFSGENWLKAAIGEAGATTNDPSTVNTITKQVVGSFTRDASGNVAVKTIDVELNETTILFDESGLGKGILDTEAKVPGQLQLTDGDGTTRWVAGIDQETIDGFIAGVTTDAATDTREIASGTDTILVIDNGAGAGAYLKQGDIWVELSVAPTTPPGGSAQTDESFTGIDHDADGGTTPAVNYYIDFSAATVEADTIEGASVHELDITKLSTYVAELGLGADATDEDALDVLIQFVDTQLEAMTSAAADLGSITMRIGLQEDFVSKLSDSIDSGIGRLVDADMNEESTRLKALQTQQQLGIQALSIANSSSENILSLFR